DAGDIELVQRPDAHGGGGFGHAALLEATGGTRKRSEISRFRAPTQTCARACRPFSRRCCVYLNRTTRWIASSVPTRARTHTPPTRGAVRGGVVPSQCQGRRPAGIVPSASTAIVLPLTPNTSIRPGCVSGDASVTSAPALIGLGAADRRSERPSLPTDS